MTETTHVDKVFTPKHIHASFELVLMPKKIVVWVNDMPWRTFGLSKKGRFEHPMFGELRTELGGVSWKKTLGEMGREQLYVPRWRRTKVRELIHGMQSYINRRRSGPSRV